VPGSNYAGKCESGLAPPARHPSWVIAGERDHEHLDRGAGARAMRPALSGSRTEDGRGARRAALARVLRLGRVRRPGARHQHLLPRSATGRPYTTSPSPITNPHTFESLTARRRAQQPRNHSCGHTSTRSRQRRPVPPPLGARTANETSPKRRGLPNVATRALLIARSAHAPYGRPIWQTITRGALAEHRGAETANVPQRRRCHDCGSRSDAAAARR